MPSGLIMFITKDLIFSVSHCQLCRCYMYIYMQYMLCASSCLICILVPGRGLGMKYRYVYVLLIKTRMPQCCKIYTEVCQYVYVQMCLILYVSWQINVQNQFYGECQCFIFGRTLSDALYFENLSYNILFRNGIISNLCSLFVRHRQLSFKMRYIWILLFKYHTYFILLHNLLSFVKEVLRLPITNHIAKYIGNDIELPHLLGITFIS